ncbi:MAG: gamma-glutamylcyclotransferase [Planctomycetota bacterium]|nr:MAG: gamma-glutamylcyclotransferase [Planctomycetota bacterium]
MNHDVSNLLRRLDRLEGFHGYGSREGSLYDRTIIKVETEEGPLLAWTYTLRKTKGLPIISSGNWREEREG